MKPALGTGARFSSLQQKLAAEPGVRDPGAVAASIGREKYGKKRFGKLSSKKRPRLRDYIGD